MQTTKTIFLLLLGFSFCLFFACDNPMATGPVVNWRGEELLLDNDRTSLYPQAHPLQDKFVYISSSRAGAATADNSLLCGESLCEYDVSADISKELYRHEQGLLFPDYSHDGERLLFCKQGKTVDITLMNLQSRETRLLIQSDEDTWYPRWSPDDSRIAFIRNGDLGLLSLQTTQPLWLDGVQGRVTGVCWSLDGSELIFSAENNGQIKMYAWNLANAEQRLLATNYLSGGWPELVNPPGALAAEMGPQLSFKKGSDIYLFSLQSFKKSCIAHDGDMPRWNADRSAILFSRDGNIYKSLVYVLLDG